MAAWKEPRCSRERHRETVTFHRPFSLEGVGRLLPAGSYEVVTDEELIEGLSFPVYRRVATTMLVPAQSCPGSVEMLTVDPPSLAAAIERDAAADSDKPALRSGKGAVMWLPWLSQDRKATNMAINFPNRSRSYDATRRAVRFWGL